MSLDVSYLCSRGQRSGNWKGTALVRAGSYEEMPFGPTEPIFNSESEAVNFLEESIRSVVPKCFFNN